MRTRMNDFGAIELEDERPQIWAAIAGIAAAAIGAAGTAGGAAIQANAAKKAGRQGGGGTTTVPAPKHETAIQRYISRLLALNIGNVPPSFGDFVSSGGAAKFQMQDTGLTPREALNIGLISPGGGPVPFVDPNNLVGAAPGTLGPGLSPAEMLFLGSEQKRAGHRGGLVRAYETSKKLAKAQGRPDTPKRDAREVRLQNRLNTILERERSRFTPPLFEEDF